MIERKVLKFGYGDIVVGGHPVTQEISFQQIKSCAKCGEYPKLDDTELVGECIRIKIEYKDYLKLKEKLASVKSRKISKFKFKGYTFDFTNYNKESVNVCIQASGRAINLYQLALAC